MISLHRIVATLAVLAAPAVFATGEKIALVPESSQLRETLCISMDCAAPGEKAEIVIATHQVKRGVEITVTAGGQRRLSQLVNANGDGQVSTTDLLKLTSLVVKAIEEPAAEASKVAAPAKAPVRGKAHPHLRLLAHR